MPRVKGKLSTITESPSSIREVWIRPPSTRPGAEGLIVDEPVRVIVDESGEFTANIAPGAGVLLLIGPAGMARESIPLLVAEGMTTIAEAMEAAKDFTPDVHDRLAELADEVARGIKATGDSASAASTDRGRAETAAQAAKAAQVAAASSEKQSLSAWEQLKARLLEWESRSQQLDKWQPQYEWLKENAEKSFAVVQEKITQATDAIIAQVRGDAESAKRDAATAGQHSLKAQAASKTAESAAQRIVDEAIAKLKGNAPALLDTLEELAERVKSGGSLENEIIQKLSTMADSDTVKEVKSRLDSLDIASVKGLSEALAGKASSSHTHKIADITALQKVLSNHTERINECGVEIDKKADKNGIADIITEVIGINKIEVVDRKPYQPQQGTLYLIRE
ncbi:hypothetical protein ACQXZZ_03850 [Corynebacterium diphtheriae]|uniref:hypothetical protein n=1 Tax=Corynebacterium diphtheriae TaxID=1717 RepID=UPI0008FB820D|nr:hypothetical protein [Corynebacterium diphtheriae]AWR14907.1 extracellular matrix-binding protein ebhB [Corynebacterium diphtheriae]MBG9313441.1 hypothetical protein [Corynebacterium diphtheriae bv. mitis]MBN4654184.1 hypothetical protein [Corynebacterium diphtheriae bv. mitis]OIR63408.1 hypothetical protein BHF77_02195 [Corynebacterium diphtheriae]OIR65502.1 hypothetical protein BHF76_10350 [Corynebacterium diphtheriae]